MPLALYNFGVPKHDFDAPSFEGFVLREPLNFEAAERSEGFVGRSGYPGEPGPRSWGLPKQPRFLEDTPFDAGLASLSLWRDVESLMAFAYSGVHANALKHAANWMGPRTWPPLVLWWVTDGQRPKWSDGVERLEHLHDHGPSAHAFTFKQPFAPDGGSLSIDREKVRPIAEENRFAQADLLTAVESMKV